MIPSFPAVIKLYGTKYLFVSHLCRYCTFQELENLKKLSERKAKEADISKNQTGKLRSKPKTGAK